MKEIGRYNNILFIYDGNIGNLTFWAGTQINDYFLLGGGRILRNIQPTQKYKDVDITQTTKDSLLLVPFDCELTNITWIVSGSKSMTDYMIAYHKFLARN